MPTIKDFLNKYYRELDPLDLELLIAAAINKPREFVLTHPEYKINKTQNSKLKSQILRKIKHEPLAYILGQKEFYGLEFKVNQHTLIPRPETELLVENVLKLQPKNKTIIDVGTGSGNIIISIAKMIENLKFSRQGGTPPRRWQTSNLKFIGIDINTKALTIARQNAKHHNLDKKIKFIYGNLLEPIIKNTNHKPQTTSYLIVANLPYLSKKIYNSAPKDVKNYEPKSALLSSDYGLNHYKKLFQQLKKLQTTNHKLQTFIEFSPEQKTPLKKAILSAFPQCHLTFLKDLAGKYRIIQIEL